MRSPADILYHHLLGLSTIGDLMVALLRDTPDDTTSVFDTAGRLDGRLMESGKVIEHYGIQIQVRGKVYLSTFQRALDIADFLDATKKESVAIGSDEVYTIWNVSRTGAIVPVGIETVDDRRRHLFTLNYVITVSQQN